MAERLNEKQLRENIAEILKKGDLATLTSKKIRQILENKFEVDLKDRKKQIDDIVMSMVDEQSDGSEESPSSKRPTSPEKRTVNVPVKRSPKKLEESPTKKQKVSVTSERVSVISIVHLDKKNTKEVEGSETDDEDSDNDIVAKDNKGRHKRQKTKKSMKEKTKSPKKEKEEKGEEKKKTGFSMPMVLSPELANLMGETHMARSEVVKRMWEIIKERNLMDPSNKRYTICDDELEKIIGQKRFLTFSMMKYLKKHIKDPSLMVE